MRIFGTFVSHRDILIIVASIGVGAGIIFGIASAYHRAERDSIRLSDAQSIMNALEIHKTLYRTLPETGPRTCDDWEIGLQQQGDGESFIKELAAKDILVTVPIERFKVSKCSYRYQKFSNIGCGEHVNYAILGMKLEGTKKGYHVNDVLEHCYPDIYRWTSDPHWIAFMIRE